MKTILLFFFVLASSFAIQEQFFDHLSRKDQLMDIQCEACKKVFSVLEKLDEKTLDFVIAKLYDALCPLVETKELCEGGKNTYLFQFLNNFIKSTANPEKICARLGQCNIHYKKASLQDYIDDVLSDRFTDNQKSEWLQHSKKQNSGFKFVQLTDLHIDLEYEEGYDAFCKDPFCCRGENGLPSDPSNGAKYWGTLAQCDVPLRTIQNLVEYVKKEIKPDFIIWNGDNISHDIWHQTQANQTLPTKKITEALINQGIKLYPIFGNHEAYPCDQMDFESDQSQWLLDEVSDMWKTFLNEDSLKSLRKQGFYSQYDQDKNIRFISLNTQTCDKFNFYLFQNNTDPAEQLLWFRQQLQEAEYNHQFVYIFGHIPPNDNFCQTQWAQRYNVLMERYQHVVKGQFFGHTHQDHFSFVNSEVDGNPQSIMFVAPSGTTYTYQNPSFRVFEVNGEDNHIENYHQYRLDLEKANQEGKYAVLDWQPIYNFKDEYNLKEITIEEVEKLIVRFEQDENLLKEYIYNFYAGSEHMYEEQLKQYNSRLFHEATRSYYLCGMNHSTFNERYDCIGKLRQFKDQELLLFKILEVLLGKWKYQE